MFSRFELRQADLVNSPIVILDETEIEEVSATKFLEIHLMLTTCAFLVDHVCSKLASVMHVFDAILQYCPTQVDTDDGILGSNLPSSILLRVTLLRGSQ